MKFLVIIVLASISLLANNVYTDVDSFNKQYEKYIKSMDDINDSDAKFSMSKKIKGNFGLKPYDKNYILPLSYREGSYTSYVPSDEYRSIEAEMQISLQYDAVVNLLGLEEIYSFAYTQKSMWQIYTDSSPFRETNYNPEFFITIPLYHNSDYLSLRMARFSISHQSNGQGDITEIVDTNISVEGEGVQQSWFESRSRSWNYLSAMVVMQHKSLFIGLKGWYRLPEDPKEDDNPDLIDYIGQGELFFLYPYHKAFIKGLLRHNIETGKGSMELSYSYPFAHQENVYWFAKVFSGYGETLIDYNNYITKFAIGFSFSR